MEDAEGDASSVTSRSLTDAGLLGKLLCIPRPVVLYLYSIMHDEIAIRVSEEGAWVERG